MADIFMRDKNGRFIKGHKQSAETIEKISKTHTGMLHTEDTKRRLSEMKKGGTPWNKGIKAKDDPRIARFVNAGHKAMLGKTPWNKTQGLIKICRCGLSFRVKPSHNRRVYCSKVCAFQGKNNHNWKGGITPAHKKIRKSIEYEEWRTAVFQRDNYTCQKCGTIGGILHADHIKPFAYFEDLRLNRDNGQTLCVKCHKKTETYGYKAVTWYKSYLNP